LVVINIYSVNIVDDAVIQVTKIVVFVYFHEDTKKKHVKFYKKETEISALRVRIVELS